MSIAITCDSQSLSADEDIPITQWTSSEIQSWCRATMKLANAALEQELLRMENSPPTLMKKGSVRKQCLDMRVNVIQQRWQSAKAHIPESLHDAIQEILQEETM